MISSLIQSKAFFRLMEGESVRANIVFVHIPYLLVEVYNVVHAVLGQACDAPMLNCCIPSLFSAKNKHQNVSKRANCNKRAAGLLHYSHQADVRMRSHGLLRLDDNKSAANCQQAWCKLIVKTFYPQA